MFIQLESSEILQDPRRKTTKHVNSSASETSQKIQKTQNLPVIVENQVVVPTEPSIKSRKILNLKTLPLKI